MGLLDDRLRMMWRWRAKESVSLVGEVWESVEAQCLAFSLTCRLRPLSARHTFIYLLSSRMNQLTGRVIQSRDLLNNCRGTERCSTRAWLEAFEAFPPALPHRRVVAIQPVPFVRSRTVCKHLYRSDRYL